MAEKKREPKKSAMPAVCTMCNGEGTRWEFVYSTDREQQVRCRGCGGTGEPLWKRRPLPERTEFCADCRRYRPMGELALRPDDTDYTCRDRVTCRARWDD